MTVAAAVVRTETREIKVYKCWLCGRVGTQKFTVALHLPKVAGLAPMICANGSRCTMRRAEARAATGLTPARPFPTDAAVVC